MEKITIESEVMETAIPEAQNEFTTGKSSRKPLRQWGFEVAGQNMGSPTALESHLR